jgi:hypothetical protein
MNNNVRELKKEVKNEFYDLEYTFNNNYCLIYLNIFIIQLFNYNWLFSF